MQKSICIFLLVPHGIGSKASVHTLRLLHVLASLSLSSSRCGSFLHCRGGLGVATVLVSNVSARLSTKAVVCGTSSPRNYVLPHERSRMQPVFENSGKAKIVNVSPFFEYDGPQTVIQLPVGSCPAQ